MLQGALDSRQTIRQALLITDSDHVTRELRRNSKVRVVASAHPVPDQSSLDAGTVLLQFFETMPEDASILFLLSGGASSMVEVPVDGITLQQLQQINRHLLASGKNIGAMNAWRKQFSRIKGGGLLAWIKSRQCTQLLISDVPTDDAAIIGSGPLVQSDEEPDRDDWLQSLLTAAPDRGRSAVAVDTQIIGTNATARQAVADEAGHQQLACHLHDTFITGDAIAQGRALGEYLREAPDGVHIWGAETTVMLPDKPGLGGRNQAMALSLAVSIDGVDEVSVLAAGTDGIDGNTPCAGAVVSGQSMKTIRQMGFDVEQELGKANAGTVLMAIDGIFKPGPTNTNVMDLVIAYKR